MPLFSAFAPFGQLRYSSRPSVCEIVYDSMRDGQDGAYGPRDVHQEARIYAAARCIAASASELERAGNEGRAGKTQEFFPDLERDHGLTPSYDQTEAARRSSLELQGRVLRGSRKESLDDALTTLLGTDFVEALPGSAFVSPPTQYPASPGDAGNFSTRAHWRIYEMAEETALTGSRVLAFTDAIPGQGPLLVGDKITIDPANPGLTETVPVEVIHSASTDAAGFTTNSVTVTVANAHDAGTLCTTAPFPLLGSTQRHIVVRVTASAAADARKRAAIHALMRNYLRGVTTWEIQASGTLHLLDPVTGLLDIYTLS